MPLPQEKFYISVICNKDPLNEKGCNGVREYWIINPMKKTVQTYAFSDIEDSNPYSFEDTI